MACAKSVGDLWFLVTAVGVQPCGEGPVSLATGLIRHIATLAMPSVFYCVHRLGPCILSHDVLATTVRHE